MQQNSIAADIAADHAPLADASRWNPQDTVWTLGLFGTAIGAGESSSCRSTPASVACCRC